MEAIKAGHNQYTRPGGHPQFVQQLAEFYSPLFNRKIDAMSEIVTFGGAQEGIFAILSALVNPVAPLAYFLLLLNARLLESPFSLPLASPCPAG